MADGIDRFFNALERALEGAGDATVKGMEVVGITHPQPGPEPEVRIDPKKTKKDGDKVVTTTTNKKGEVIVTERSVKKFNREIYEENIEILRARIAVFKAVKAAYEEDIKEVRALLKAGIKDSVESNKERNELRREVDDLWQEYHDRFKYTKDTTEAQEFIDEKITPKQLMIGAKPPGIDTYLKIRRDKYFCSLDDIKRVANERAKGHKSAEIVMEPEVFEGNGEELIDFYEGKIDEIDSDDDFKSFQERLDANEEWSKL